VDVMQREDVQDAIAGAPLPGRTKGVHLRMRGRTPVRVLVTLPASLCKNVQPVPLERHELLRLPWAVEEGRKMMERIG